MLMNSFVGFNLGLGPICYSCPAQIGTNGCQKIEQCGRDKVYRIKEKSINIFFFLLLLFLKEKQLPLNFQN